MAKIYLTEQQKQDDEFRRLINVGLAMQGYKQYQLADKMRMSHTTLGSKLQKPDSFKRGELRMICKVLRIAPEDMCRVL